MIEIMMAMVKMMIIVKKIMMIIIVIIILTYKSIQELFLAQAAVHI